MSKSQLFVSLFLCLAIAAHADTLITISENTSSINGTVGSLDFQFNPGALVTQEATVTISNFTGGSFVGSASTTSPSVTGGPLPTAVTIANSGGFNDYFQGFQFGNALSFTLDFGGGAVNAPDGMSTSTSIFAFSTFSDAAGITPVLTSDPNGIAMTATVNLDGSVTESVFSSQVQVSPEPGSFSLSGGALALLGIGLAMYQRKASGLSA
ncbi:MAG TPA: NF038129 family PEP-CTERM protein [Bryobacteraceae bacterium]|jgi:hypothetical protein